jgi:2,3-bisphosphoglycerate-dependent phosphoglycerate mutase
MFVFQRNLYQHSRIKFNPLYNKQSLLLLSTKSPKSTNNSDLIPLIFVRHGQSEWNKHNIFIGMTDTPLTEDGMKEARYAGLLIKEENLDIDIVYTSLLRRSTKSVWIIMQELALEWVQVIKDWRLNERNYGALVGHNKKKMVEEHGKDQVKNWRRSWDNPPPKMTKDSEYYIFNDPRYNKLGLSEKDIPLSESLKDVTIRTSQFWDEEIVPLLNKKKKIMIVGHENNLRSLIKRLDNISEKDIINLELPRAIPLLYLLDPITLKPVPQNDNLKNSSTVLLNGRYLCDQEQLKEIALKDQLQVYDLTQKESLETSPYLGFPPKTIVLKPPPTIKST